MTEIYFGIPLIEWIGYTASTLVLISLSLSSLVKLRIFNFFGSSVFSFYGFFIGALPVGIMNLLIALFNIYYLRFLLFKRELFDVVESHPGDAFLNKYLNYHKEDIARFFPSFFRGDNSGKTVLLALRDARIAGVFMVDQGDEEEAEIILDYVTPEYRDYRTGRFLLKKYKEQFKAVNSKKLVCKSSNAKHIFYLNKMGFEQIGDDKFALLL